MKKILTIALMFVSIMASGIDYHFSSSGNDDTNSGTSASPWQTITKLNSMINTLNPGDRILFNRGDTFSGTIQTEVSGVAGSPIIIGAFGSGADPVITGFATISGWTDEGNNVYSKAVNFESDPKMVTLDGNNVPKGRYPNDGYLYYDSFDGAVSITDNDLPASPDWMGAELVLRPHAWLIYALPITNHSGPVITYSGGEMAPRKGYGYFIQNDIDTFDEFGEWCYINGKLFMYFGGESPDNHTVKVSSLDKLISITGEDYITIENLDLQGANDRTINLDNTKSENITIQNCSISFSGNIAIYGVYCGNITIDSNFVTQTNSTAIYINNWYGTGYDNLTVSNNIISYTGMLPGMGSNGSESYFGLLCTGGENNIYEHNAILFSGYTALAFNGVNSKVRNNYIDNFCSVKDDGAGIYTSEDNLGVEITNNIIVSGMGAPEGTRYKDKRAHGIYSDDKGGNINISGNTIAHCRNSGIFIHNSHDIIIENNICFNNGEQVKFQHDDAFPDNPIRNITMKNNIFYAQFPEQYVLSWYSFEEDVNQFGTSDSNCYERAINRDGMFRTHRPSTQGKDINLSEWQSISSTDSHSYMSSIFTGRIDGIRFEYNPTNNNRVITLSKPMNDVKGINYENSVTLQPFTSVILLDPDAVSVNEIKDERYNVSVFPNPTSDFINVQVNNPEGLILTVEILDQTGRALLNSKIKDLTGMKKFNLITLTPGFYVLKVSAKDMKSTQAILFQKLSLN
ncbi:right-handed parallel beta-helix repeat-containing protein [Bacteroidota bacterium]